ncbi:MAG: YceI family protein, partial [Flavobacterium sp.]
VSFAGGAVVMTADMNTIDTDNDKRDGHLKTADFFNTEKFPTVSFQSTSLTKITGDMYQLNGNLTLHGITKPITMSVLIKSIINPMNNKPLTGCRVSGKIRRSEFDIAKSTPEAILADEVTITGNLEFGRE